MWRKRTAMPGAGSLWGSHIALENRPCCEEGGGRTSEAEERVLATVPGRAHRSGRTLRLKLESGRSLRLTDCDDQSSCEIDEIRIHRLAAWWPAQGYYVVAVTGYAEQMAYLIRERDGLVVRANAPPILSPNGRYAAATDLTVAKGGGTTEIWDMRADPPMLLAFAPSASCPRLFSVESLPEWTGDSQVSFSDVLVAAGEAKPKGLTLRIEGGEAEWLCSF
jgi:hypothetical protein